MFQSVESIASDSFDVRVPVSEWGDDKSFGASKEFILIFEIDVSDRDDTFVVIFDEVESRLLLPLEVTWRFDVHPDLMRFQHLQ